MKRRPPSETKAQRFVRVASYRVTKALEAIERIGNCGQRRTYEFTDAQVAEIKRALDLEIGAALECFQPPAPGEDKRQIRFEFDGGRL